MPLHNEIKHTTFEIQIEMQIEEQKKKLSI